MKRLRLPFVSRSLRRDLLASKGAASLSALLVCGLGAACGLKESPQAPPATRTAAITYGELDTKHDAVIAIIHKVGGQVMACGATIVATKGRSAYALTAAHCLAKTTTSGSLILPPEAASKDSLSVVFGDNWFVPDPEIKIILDLAIHPGFTGTSHENDFGMVRFAIPGTTVSTIPPMTPADDDLAVGTKLDMVGFGMTEDRQKNTLRRHIVKPISVLEPYLIRFDQQGITGGSCQGDSGGPALTTDTKARVAGIVFGGDSCTSVSIFGRVSSAYEAFIKPFLAMSTGDLSCYECRLASVQTGGPCIKAYNDCNKNADCPAYYACVTACKDAACGNACATDHPAGAALSLAMRSCTCQTACIAECKADPACKARPGCGMTLPDSTCESCSASSCCQVESACAADPACRTCAVAKTPDPSCGALNTYKAWVACLRGHCVSECGEIHCAFASARASCQTCVEGSCCSESLACEGDSTCQGCKTSTDPAATCGDNPRFSAFETCVSKHCASPCNVLAGGDGGGNGVDGAAPSEGGCAIAHGGPAKKPAQAWIALLIAFATIFFGNKNRRRRLFDRAPSRANTRRRPA